VYFVPTTINYALVLEAETLVEDWLKEKGRARYIIEDDEFSQHRALGAFFRKFQQPRARASSASASRSIPSATASTRGPERRRSTDARSTPAAT
jgi:hypothetical protein